MKNMLLGMVLLSLVNIASVWAAGNDELWEVSAKMEMEGMPFAMPGQTSKVCMQKGHEKDPNNSVPKDKDQSCTMSEVKTSGNKSNWKIKCDGKAPMTGSGEMTYGNGTYSGKVKMHSEDGDMTMVYDGKRIGTCNYQSDGPQAKMQAMMKENQDLRNAETAKECKEALDNNRYSQFLKPDCAWATDASSKKICAQMACSGLRPQMCDRLANALGSPDSYKEIADDKGASKLARECGLPFEKKTREFCRKQLDGKNYKDLAQYCEKEARPMFDKHCAGRDYTAAMDSEYGPICKRFGKWRERDDENANESHDSSASEDSVSNKKVESEQGNPANKILDGAKSLKGMFGF